MRFILKRTATVILYFICVTSLTINLLPSHFAFAAGTSKLYIIAKSSTTVNIGDTITIDVKSYSTDTYSSTSGNLTYPSNLLQAQNPCTTSSASQTCSSNFNSPTVTVGSNTIDFNASRSSASSGTAQIFSISFIAKAAGNANLGFTGSSKVGSTTCAASSLCGSAAFTINSPSNPPSTPSPAPNPPASTPSSPSTTTKVPSTTPQSTTSTGTSNDTADDAESITTPDTTGIVTNVSIAPSYTSSTVTWTVNASDPVTSLAYGQSSGQLGKQGDVQKQPDGTFATTLNGLQPGEIYYFSITGNGSNTATGTYSSTIHTSGYPVVITVTENKIAAKNAQIKIGANSYMAGANGKATFGLAAGSYTGTISTDTSSLDISLTVVAKTVPTDGSTPDSQAFSFDLTSSPLEGGPGTGTTILTFVGVLLGGFVLLTVGFLIFVNYRRRRFEADVTSPHQSSSSVVIEDGYDWRQEASQEQSVPPPSEGGVTDPSSEHSSPVHLSEEEPLDMFEKARQQPLPQPSELGSETNEKLQGPNVPHSTTP